MSVRWTSFVRARPWRLVCVCLLVSSIAAAQEKEPPKKSPAAAEFDKVFGQWKATLGKLRDLQMEYKNAKPEDRPPIQKTFDETIAKAETMLAPFKKAGEAAFVADPADKDTADFLAALALDAKEKDQYEESLHLAKVLIEHKYANEDLNDLVGVSAYEVSSYDDAEKYLKLADEAGKLSAVGRNYLKDLPEVRADWEKELAIRKAETKPDGDPMALPRVLLKTTQGDILLEFFENEAPGTVGNFISLVEKKFYDGLVFHRVLKGFMAQAGCPKGDGTGDPGYKIKCECHQENFRKHFRGSLSMAKSPERDTGGSQFYLCFRPTRHLDGEHTVFGRVIKGIEVLGKLKRRAPDGPEPDKIISATVVRKRDHKYGPDKVGDGPVEAPDEPSKKPDEDGDKTPKKNEKKPDEDGDKTPKKNEKKPDANKSEQGGDEKGANPSKPAPK